MESVEWRVWGRGCGVESEGWRVRGGGCGVEGVGWRVWDEFVAWKCGIGHGEVYTGDEG